LKKCFDYQYIPMLHEAIANMPEEDARYHMKRCIDSGVWVPQKIGGGGGGGVGGVGGGGGEETEGNVEATGE
jgi:cell division cycle protein 37